MPAAKISHRAADRTKARLAGANAEASSATSAKTTKAMRWPPLGPKRAESVGSRCASAPAAASAMCGAGLGAHSVVQQPRRGDRQTGGQRAFVGLGEQIADRRGARRGDDGQAGAVGCKRRDAADDRRVGFDPRRDRNLAAVERQPQAARQSAVVGLLVEQAGAEQRLFSRHAIAFGRRLGLQQCARRDPLGGEKGDFRRELAADASGRRSALAPRADREIGLRMNRRPAAPHSGRLPREIVHATNSLDPRRPDACARLKVFRRPHGNSLSKSDGTSPCPPRVM